jgi:hypothetical protein
MLEEQRWGLAILVSQKLARALPKPTWLVVLGRSSGEALTASPTTQSNQSDTVDTKAPFLFLNSF